MTSTENQLVDHFFRHESASLIAVLTRAFGIRRIDLIEDMVQVAMVEAMHAWKQRGVPDSPAAWIHQTAKHRILDALRREKTYEKAVASAGPPIEAQNSLVDEWLDQAQLPDSLLRMMFVCCHPTLDRKTQIALTLKTLCGFGFSEIASGLLLPVETVKKRVSRAKRSLADANVSLELPGESEVAARLGAIHDVLYLMFNEGYSTSHGPDPIRDDICEEAARLCHLLCASAQASPATHALLAMMLFHAARLESRIDNEGKPVLLEDQDRSRWDRDLIRAAQHQLALSKTDQPTTIHLEAAIAMQHCIAATVASTDWPLIVRFYDRLIQMHDSPMYRLNRAIALGETGDTNDALADLRRLRQHPEMKSYPLLECAIARLHEINGNWQPATDAYLAALSKATAMHEKQLIKEKFQSLTQRQQAESS